MWICWILCWPEPDRVSLISHMWNSPSCLCRSGTSMFVIRCGLFCTGCARRIFCFEIMFHCAEWKQKEEIHYIKNHNTEHNRMTCSEAPQQDEQTCDSLRTSVLMWLWLNMLVQNWNLQLIQSCCKVKICGFNSQSVMNEGCFTCPASVWRVVVKNLPTRHINGAVWRHRVDVTVRSQ